MNLVDILIIIAAGFGAVTCAVHCLKLLLEPKKPEGCWYKPSGFLRDDNYRRKHFKRNKSK